MVKDFKPILGILLRFVIIYLLLLLAYQCYLNYFISQGLDPYSRFIAQQVVSLQNYWGYPSALYDDIAYQQMWFFVKGKYVTRMVEGCNAISVIILFLSFVFAFYKGKKTFVYVILGTLFLSIINIVRVVGLNIINSDYINHNKTFHDYIFPSMVYGSVILLWLIWIKFFALKNENN